MNTTTIIVAAGSGRRFGGNMPKQFLPLCGRPLLMNTIDAFRRALPQGRIVLVLSGDALELWDAMCREHCFDSPEVIVGGATRWESVKHAVDSLIGENPGTIVLVHDGARPLVPVHVIKRVVACAVNTDGAIPAIPVADSLRKLNDDETSSEPVDRSLFRAVQTPQGSTLWRMSDAYSLPYDPSFTDDASVLTAAGYANMVLVDGSDENIKITTPVDLLVAEAIMETRKDLDNEKL